MGIRDRVTMYEIFAFNKVDSGMVDDGARRANILKCLLEENSKEHGYAPGKKKEGLCVELNRYRQGRRAPVSYKHLRPHETVLDVVCRLLLPKTTTTPRTHISHSA